MVEIIAFAGPCLAAPGGNDAALGQRLAGRVELWPPARRGDVLRALCQEPTTLVLLDGFFYDVPSVTHKELLYALDSGVRVIGAASMGALRAAELWRHGMEGAGTVFEWFRDGVLEGDDEVTILHSPADFGWEPVTHALVEVRHALAEMIAAGELEGDAEPLIAALAELPFGERFPDTVEQLARRHMGEEVVARLAARLAATSIKRIDAERALASALDENLQGPGLPEGTSRNPLTLYCGYFREWHLGPSPEAASVARQEAGEPGVRKAASGVEGSSHQLAWQMVQLFHPGTARFVASRQRRFLLASAAERAGLEPHGDRVEERMETARQWALDHHDHPLLPVAELRDEARERSLAELAWEAWGGWGPVCELLAGPLGLLPASGIEGLLGRFRTQGELQPPWILVRSFVFSSWLEPAHALAREAREIHGAFRVWSKGARVKPGDLRTLAAGLWHCLPSEVPDEASRRGLHPSDGYSAGYREALETIAAAERLARPLNAYPERREALSRMPFGHAFAPGPWESCQ